MYVRVRLEQAEATSGIVVPQQAVTRGSTGDSVMVVDTAGVVAPRPVKVGSAQGGNWLILEGLKPGETVMVDGFQKLRGNAPVKPVPWQPPGAASAPPAAGPQVPAAASASAVTAASAVPAR
jgi:membrane fusion protein (multidrug efflux system)